MSEIADDSIDRLRSNVRRLVERVRELESENATLVAKNGKLTAESTDLKLKLKENEKKLGAVTLGGALIDVSGGTRVAHQRVNALLRDIDKCIALVNKSAK